MTDNCCAVTIDGDDGKIIIVAFSAKNGCSVSKDQKNVGFVVDGAFVPAKKSIPLNPVEIQKIKLTYKLISSMVQTLANFKIHQS